MRVLLRDLAPNQEYGVQFRLIGSGMQSDWSPIARFTTDTDALAPANVTGLTVAAIGTAFEVTWNKVTTNTDGSELSDFKDYQVSITAGGVTRSWFVTGERFDLPIEVNTNAFGSPQPNISVSVSARDNNLNIADDAPSVSESNETPPAPENFAGRPIVNGINFTWDKVSISDLKCYRVYIGTSTEQIDTLVYEGPSNNFTWSSVDFATNHYFKVASVDVFNQEALSGSVSGSPLPYDNTDKAPPSEPTWATSWFSSETDLTNKYNAVANVTLAWNANSETDMGAYIIRYKKTSDTVWSQARVNGTALTPPATSVKLIGLAINTNYNFELAAVDKTGNTSDFVAAPANGTTTRDTTAPNVPSTPLVSSYMGLVNAEWNGKNSANGTMSGDVANIEVHVSQTSDFTPSISTLESIMVANAGPNKTLLAELPYDVPHFIKFIAVDYADNKSGASAQAQGTAVRLTGTVIEEGAISTEHMTANTINGDRIMAQTLEVGKIKTGEIAADQRIIAGPALGTHAEMSDTGFRAYRLDTSDGSVDEVVRIGTDTDDTIALIGSDGQILAGIDVGGVASLSGLNVTNDPRIQGTPLSEMFDKKSQIVAWTHAWGTTGPTTDEIGLIELAFTSKLGHSYAVHATGLMPEIEGGGDRHAAPFKLRATFDGTAPMTNSFVMGTGQVETRYDLYPWENPSASIHAMHHETVGDRTVRVLLTMVRPINATSVDIVTDSAIARRYFWIEDLGRSPSDTGQVNTGGGTRSGGVPPPPPPPAPKVDGETIFTADWVSNFRGNGTYVAFSEAYQGYEASNGRMRSFLGFPNMTGPLAGCAIRYVKVWVWFGHWWNNAGGYPVLSWHANDGKVTSPINQDGNEVVYGPLIGRGAGAWINVPVSWGDRFRNGTAHGVALGPGPDNGSQYYGRANGPGQANAPKIAVGWTK